MKQLQLKKKLKYVKKKSKDDILNQAKNCKNIVGGFESLMGQSDEDLSAKT